MVYSVDTDTPNPPRAEPIRQTECRYAELHAISNYSFLRGASFPEELVEQADRLGYEAIAIVDECSLSGVVRAHNEAKNRAIKLIVGSEFYLDDGLHLILLAARRTGYGALCQLITRGRNTAPKGSYELGRGDFDGLDFSDCLAIWLPHADEDNDSGFWLKTLFPNRVWIGVTCVRDGEDEQRLTLAQARSDRCGLPLVACGDVLFHHPRQRHLADVLNAIRHNLPLHEMGHRLFANGEHYLRPRHHLHRLFPTSLLSATLDIADRCDFSLDELRYEYPEVLIPKGFNKTQWLRHLTETGIVERWPDGIPDTTRAQIEKELTLISELNYEHYFLTVHDLVRFARSQSILCQGRGSAANSAVCYCLGITAVDPTQVNLLFERFISKERNEPPDIDVDFEHERREEVIQYIYRKYGRDHAALAATIITYRAKSAIRDVGKALGFALDQVDRIAKSIRFQGDRQAIDERLIENGFDPSNQRIKMLVHFVDKIIGFPRHLSQHVGGFVISNGLLSEMVPIENAAMVDRTVIQWEKDDLESLGLLKVDVLALGMLTAIRKCFDYIEHYKGKRHSLASIEPDDPDVYRMIQKADTIGVFQIESRAQMSMLPRLKPANYYDLVVEIAIVRPGPIQGDMVHPYLQRRENPELVDYPSDALKSVLGRTLGVPIFQEQVMQIAIVAAGFTPGEADQLRRAMAAWKKRGGLEKYQSKLLEGMMARGYTREFAENIFNQIKGFGDYGFPESHSASFALLAYVSSWLKHYEPAAFCCALLNSQPMGFYQPSQLVADARRHGVEVRPIDVNHSQIDSALEPRHNDHTQPALRLGLRMIKGLSRQSMEAIVRQRSDTQFHSIRDLAQRTQMGRNQISTLAGANALTSIKGNRHQAYWESTGIESPMPLTGIPEFPEATPLLRKPTDWENTLSNYATTGLSLSHHPLALLRPTLDQGRIIQADALGKQPNDAVIRVAGLVTNRQRPMTASGVIFMTLEDETGYANIVIWPKLVEKQRNVLLQSQLIVVTGKVQTADNVTHIIARNLQDYSHLAKTLEIRSRNFH